MKRFGLFLLCSFIFFISKGEKTIIEGHATAIPDGEIIYLFQNFGKIGTGIGCDTVRNGRFKFVVDADTLSDKVDLICFSRNFVGSRGLYMDSGASIKINADNPVLETWNVESTISKQAEMDEYMLNSKELSVEYYSYQINLAKVMNNPDATPEEKNNARTEYERSASERDSIYNLINLKNLDILKSRQHTDVWLEKFSDMAQELTYTNPTETYIEELKELYATMTDDEKKTKDGETIKAYLFPPDYVKVGDKFHDADLFDLDGNIHHISDFAGKWIIIEFWSCGCAGCVESIKHLKELQETFPEEIAIISISQDVKSIWEKGSESLGITWNNWNDLKEGIGIFNDYNIQGFPTFVIINPDGIVTEMRLGLGQFKRMFQRLLTPEKLMAVSFVNGTMTVDNPKCLSNTTEECLTLDKVVMDNNSTTLHFSAYYYPNYWIKISPECVIETPDGNRLSALRADGIEFDKEFYPGDDGSFKFSITFPAIPEDTNSFDFIESPTSSWRITGIPAHTKY